MSKFKLQPKSTVLAMAATTAAVIPQLGIAADIELTPPAGGGVTVTDSSGGTPRLRVDDNGTVTVSGLPSAPALDNVVCFDGSGALGGCTSGAITGPQGPQGVQGAQGDAGPQGSTGAQGLTGAQGAQGVVGAQGPAGVQGTMGAQGPQGGVGAQGATGPGVLSGSSDPLPADGVDGDFFINTNTSTLFGPKSSGAWGSGTSLIGPQGAQGNAGPQGAQGTIGSQGAQGAIGPQGVQGAIGPQGVQGAIGPQGVQGAIGPQGVQGAVGAQGPQGATGAQGAQGSQGPQGAQGDTGSYTAGSGIAISAGTISLTTSGCSSGQVLQYDGSNWACVTPSGGSSSFTIRTAVNASSSYFAEVNCNPGEKAIGGSCFTSGNSVYGDFPLCTGSTPCVAGDTSPTGWRCEYTQLLANNNAMVLCQ